MTSHDVISRLRKITKVKQIGHSGTLDPFAQGVLPVAIGKATRLLEFLSDDKEYLAEVSFGKNTTTYDIEGDVVFESEIKITEIDSENDIYIDKQDLNAIKNILCKKHINKRIKYRPIEKGYINKKSTEKYPEEITYLDNICNSKAEEFYQQHGINNPEWGLESTKDIEGKKIYVGKYCIRYELGYCSKLKREDTPPFPWKIQNKYGTIHNLEFDCKNCKMHVIY